MYVVVEVKVWLDSIQAVSDKMVHLMHSFVCVILLLNLNIK